MPSQIKQSLYSIYIEFEMKNIFLLSEVHSPPVLE